MKLLTSNSLAVYGVGRSDKGMYQCLVTNKGSSAQGMAELKLGGKLYVILQHYRTKTTKIIVIVSRKISPYFCFVNFCYFD